MREYPDNARRAESYWHEHTVCPDTGSVIIGRPFSQHDCIGAAAAFDVWDCAPGLIAPLGTPVADPHPGLIDGPLLINQINNNNSHFYAFSTQSKSCIIQICYHKTTFLWLNPTKWDKNRIKFKSRVEISMFNEIKMTSCLPIICISHDYTRSTSSSIGWHRRLSTRRCRLSTSTKQL